MPSRTANDDGDVSLAEVMRYLDEEMTYQSTHLFGAAGMPRTTNC